MRSRAPRQFARFAAVGVGNTLLSLAVYAALSSAALAFSAGAVNGYFLNSRWTFGSRGSKIRYLLVQLAGLGATAAITRRLGYRIALPVVTAGTFAANRTWTFSERASGR
jgi:putative flippase GtrA